MGRGYSVNDVRLLSRLAERARVVAGNWYSERRARSAADFFFQAEDGIRDLTVTRVQTCALPILLEGGASFNQQRSTLDLSDNFVAARGAAAFRHRFTATAYFEQLAEFLPSLENGDDLRINTETALVAPISGQIALKASYAIRFDNLPAPGFKKTDRILTSGIQVTF